MWRRAFVLLTVIAVSSACGPSEIASKERAFEAAHADDAKLLKRQLKLGISPNAVDKGGASLLYVATGPKGGMQVIRALLDAGADPNHGQGKYTPLMNASGWVNEAAVELLLGSGANPNLKNENGETAFETTGMAGGREAVVKERIRRGQQSSVSWGECNEPQRNPACGSPTRLLRSA